MKKAILLFVVMYSMHNAYAQEIYFKTGKNFTQYDYKNDSESSPKLQSGTGALYEIGYAKTLKNEKMKYNLGLSLNEYNAIGGNSVSSYSWNTQYLGLQNTFSFAFIKKGGFEARVNGGLNLGTIIYGKQNINGQYFDLSSQKEFSGFQITPSLGLQASYNINRAVYLSVGYAYCKSFNLSNNTSEKLSFNTNQIQFGIHFINK